MSNKIAIALDAGHGGRDPGAVGIVKESVVGEKIISFLNEFLTTDQNYQPVLCRSLGLGTNETISIPTRTQIANEAEAKLLISSHLNSYTAAGPSGIECYPKVPKMQYHKESVEFSRILINELKDMQPDIRGIDGIRYRYYDSEQFAESNDTNLNNDETYYGMVRIPNCPAVLVELAFVNTKKDAERFITLQKQKQAAARYYHAICKYFKTIPIFDKAGISTTGGALVSGAFYTLKNLLSGKYLNLYAGKSENGTNVVQWSKDGSSEQMWRLLKNGINDSYLLYSACSVKHVLDAYLPKTEGANADIWIADEPKAQELLFTKINAGYKITLKYFPKLALTAIGTTNGSETGKTKVSNGNVYWSEYIGATNQIWIVE